MEVHSVKNLFSLYACFFLCIIFCFFLRGSSKLFCQKRLFRNFYYYVLRLSVYFLSLCFSFYSNRMAFAGEMRVMMYEGAISIVNEIIAVPTFISSQ